MPWTWTPTSAYALEALRIQRQMQARGLDLDHHQLHELAHASLGPAKKWVEQEPELTPEGHRILDQIVEERSTAAPDPRELTRPEIRSSFRADPTAPGHSDTPARADFENGQGQR